MNVNTDITDVLANKVKELIISQMLAGDAIDVEDTMVELLTSMKDSEPAYKIATTNYLNILLNVALLTQCKAENLHIFQNQLSGMIAMNNLTSTNLK